MVGMEGKSACSRMRFAVRRETGKVYRRRGSWGEARPPVLGRRSHFGKDVLATAR